MKQLFLVLVIVICSLNLFGQKDTTAKADTLYQLTFRANELNTFLLAIFSPDDISPNTRKALDAWLRKEIKVIPPKPKPK